MELREVLEDLTDPSPDRRCQAVRELARRNDPEALEHILPLASDPDASVRYYAKKAIASLGAAATRGTTASGAADSNAAPGGAAASAGESEGASDDAVSAAAGRPARTEEPEPALEVMPRATREKVEQIQRIGERREKGRLPELLARLAVEQDRYLKATLVKAIGRMGVREAARHVIPLLKDPDSRVVANAVEAIEELRDPDGHAAMLDLLSHRDSRIKGNIAKALWTYSAGDVLGRNLVMDRVRTMLGSAEPWTRESAVFVLSKIDAPEALPLLAKAASDADPAIAKRAADVIRARRGEPRDRDDTHKEFSTTERRDPAVAAAATPTSASPSPSPGERGEGASSSGPDPGRITSVRHAAVAMLGAGDDPRSRVLWVGVAFLSSCGALFLFLVIWNVVSIVFLDAGGSPERAATVAPGAVATATPSAPGAEIAGLIGAGHFDRAIEGLGGRPLVSLSPEERGLLARAYREKADRESNGRTPKAACDTLREWMTRDPDNPEPAMLLGLAALRIASDVPTAKSAAERLEKLAPGSAEAEILAGEILFTEGDARGAIERFERAMKIAPKWGLPYFFRAGARMTAGDAAAAGADFKSAVNLDSENPLFHLGLGIWLHQNGAPRDALAELDLATSRLPDHDLAWREFGRVALTLGNPSSAVRHLRRAIECAPDNVQSRLLLGRALREAGMPGAAVEELARLRESERENRDLLYELASAHLDAGTSVPAEEIASELGRMQPEPPGLHELRGRIEELRNRPDGARAAYLQALEAGPRSPSVHILLATLSLRLGDAASALKTAEMGLSAFPGNAHLKLLKAVSLAGQEKIPDALAVLAPLLAASDLDDGLRRRAVELQARLKGDK